MTTSPSPIVWVKVEKPVFDLWGVIVSSLSLTVILVAGALVAGSLLGALLVARNRRRPVPERTLLHLDAAA